MTIFSDRHRNRRNFSEFPLIWLAICLAGGIFTANFVELKLLFCLSLTLVAIVSSIFCLLRRKLRLATILVLLTFFGAGAFLAASEKARVTPDRISQLYDRGEINSQIPIELVGTLQNEPEETINGYFLLLRTEQIVFAQREQLTSGTVRFFVPLKDQAVLASFEELGLHYGARIRVGTRLTREDRFRNPGYLSFRDFLRNKELDAIGTIKDFRSIQKLNDMAGFNLLAQLYQWRASLVRQFRTHFSLATAGVLSASLLNNRYFLDKSSSERFREGGTFHVLVISGVHITFIGLLIAWLMRNLTKNLWAQFLVANILLWAFSLAVGAEAPVTRAALMFTVFHAAVLFGREGSPLNALGAATLALLVWRPANLFDQSFQLTLVSVTAIVAFSFPLLEKMQKIGSWQPSENTPAPPNCAKWLKTLCETLFWSERAWRLSQERQIWKAKLFKSDLAIKLEQSRLQPLWRFVLSSILVSLIVTAWLLPFSALYFHRLSLAAIFLNVFVGALIAVESFLGVFAVLVAQINLTLAQPFIAWTEALNFLLTYSAEPFLYTKLASIRLPVYSGAAKAVYWAYYLPLIAFAVLAYGWNPFKQSSINNRQAAKNKTFKAALTTVYCVLLIAIIFHPLSATTTDGRLRIDFLDVGQGDAALITTPNNVKILIDGGGRPNFAANVQTANGAIGVFEPDSRSIGEAVVSEFLWEKGLIQVDFLVSTHADTDHIDGLNDVARNFAVNTAFVGRTPSKDPEFLRFAETLRKHRILVQKIARGDELEIDNVKIEVLSPFGVADENAASDNNNSVVFRIVYKNRAFLFTGDVEAKAERMLLAEPSSLACDVVKVAHHGSRTSSIEDFVKAANATFAVISVGRESPYSHPHREILERWRNAGAHVLTTGESGTISFTTNGEDLNYETFVNN